MLGNTGLKVSKICVGTDYADVYGSSSLGQEILLKGFDYGINFWDTSESYGSYPAIQGALKKLCRSEIVIASKSYRKDIEGAKKDLTEALNEIGTDYLDIFLLHAVDTLDDYKTRSNVLQFLLKAKKNGIVRAIGVSTHSADFALTLAEMSQVEVVLTVLNMKGLEIRHGDLQLMHSAVKRLNETGKGVYLMKVLARGKLANSAEEALEYVLRIPHVHSVSVGIRNLRELETAVKVERAIQS
jgi:aryl-alcohol dehydrogenase-like predicted oxidoreductase